MTPDALAAVHAQCFTTPRPWTAAEFRSLLAAPGVFLETQPDGFALGRVIADEAELLTIAVVPKAQRCGRGKALLKAFLHRAQSGGATRAFLEVAADNRAALALYTANGFRPCGQRPGYYKRAGGGTTDALLFEHPLPAPPR